MERTRDGAYSLRYTATSKPTGSANAAAMEVTRSVPAMSGQMPKCFSSPKSGAHVVPVKNSHTDTWGIAKNEALCASRITKMVNVVTIESKAQARSAPRISRSVPMRAVRERRVPRRFAAAARTAAVEISATFDMVSGVSVSVCYL